MLVCLACNKGNRLVYKMLSGDDQFGKFHRPSPCLVVSQLIVLYAIHENINNTEDIFGT